MNYKLLLNFGIEQRWENWVARFGYIAYINSPISQSITNKASFSVSMEYYFDLQ